jgi:CDP-glycerol glycerophosphotransferase (TagB/SpsB family)
MMKTSLRILLLTALALLTACDMVITDYSSIGGDFMLLGRPTVYYQPDVGDYHRERAFYFDVDKSPLIVAHDEGALMDILSRPIDGAENCRKCLAFFGASETGHAARAVAEWIAGQLDED